MLVGRRLACRGHDIGAHPNQPQIARSPARIAEDMVEFQPRRRATPPAPTWPRRCAPTTPSRRGLMGSRASKIKLAAACLWPRLSVARNIAGDQSERMGGPGQRQERDMIEPRRRWPIPQRRLGLAGLCPHFRRRGLRHEHRSYTPITRPSVSRARGSFVCEQPPRSREIVGMRTIWIEARDGAKKKARRGERVGL
jgi:hypothetical protein